MASLKGSSEKEKVKQLLGVPGNCLWSNKLRKDSGDIICSSHVIIDHDGCVTNEGGCDAVAVSLERRKTLLIEVKSGTIDQHDASDAVQQLENCFDYYRPKLGNFDIIPVFLKVGRKRLNDSAREKLNRGSRKLKGTIQTRRSGDDLSSLR